MRGSSRSFHRVLVVALLATLLLGWLPSVSEREGSAISPVFQWPNTLVDDAPAMAGSARVAATSDGVFHAVWIDRRTGTTGAYYSRSTDAGLTWGSSRRLDDGGSSVVADPDIAAAPTGGDVYVVYRDYRTGDANVYASVSWDAGQTWRPSVRVDDAPGPTVAGHPVVDVDAAGTVYVAWEDWRNSTAPYQLFFSRSTDRGVSWSTNVQITEAAGEVASLPAIAAEIAGRVTVVWQQDDGTSVRIASATSPDSGATWGLNTVRSAAPGDGMTNPDIAADGGRTYAVWTNRTGANQSIAVSVSLDGASWSRPVTVDDGSAVVNSLPDNASVVIVAGSPFVVWDDGRNGNRDVFASGSSDDGAIWGDCPSPCASDNDARADDTGASASDQVAPAAADAGLRLVVVWQDDRGGGFDIYSSRYITSPIRITEFADAPDGNGEAVEIANLDTSPVDLAGYRLAIDGASYDLSPLGSLPGGAYRVVGNRAGADLRPPSFGGLGNEGGVLEIHSPRERTDRVAYGTMGVAPDPLPGSSTARHLLATGYTQEWAMDTTPTLGRPNDGPGVVSAPPLILNDVFFDAPSANTSQRYLELYYAGSTSLNTTGFRLVGGVSFDIVSGVLLTPSNSFAVMPNVPGVSGLLDSLRASGDNLYLYDPSGALLDMVGWTTDHGTGTSVCRVPETSGAHAGYDDASSAASGWRFDCPPGLRLIGIGPSQTRYADPGDTVSYPLAVANHQGDAAFVEFSWNSPPPGLTVEMFEQDEVTPLPDSNGNGMPDLTLGAQGSGGDVVDIFVHVRVTSSGPSLDSWVARVTAVSEPLVRTFVDLETALYPFLKVDRSADPTTITLRGTGGGEETAITVHLSGRGNAIPGRPARVADVVFVIDDTGSMGSWIDQAKLDVGRITDSLRENVTDIRFGLVSYKDVPEIDVDADLTSDVSAFRLALGGLFASGGADGPEDPDAGLQLAANLSWRPDPVAKVMVLVGDAPAHDNVHLVQVAKWAYEVRNIHTNAIQCGDDSDVALWFNETAKAGRGFFTYLGTPDRMADAIITGILLLVPTIDVAALDPNPADANPLVRDVLPPYIAYVPGTFLDPETAAPKEPAYIGGDADGNTILEWNVSVVTVHSVWAVQYRVTSSRTGLVPTNVVGLSRTSFNNWSGAPHELPLPEAPVTVVGPIPETDLVVGAPKFIGAFTYIRSSTPLSFSVLDRSGAGIRRTQYRIDGGPWVLYAQAGFGIPGQRAHIVEWFSEDNQGGIEAQKTATLWVDDQPPVTHVFPPSGPYSHETRFQFSGEDDGSGVALTEYRIDGGPWTPFASSFRLADGEHEVGYRSVDNLGNLENEQDLRIRVGTPAATPWNAKPIVAAIFAVGLAAFGAWAARRAPWRKGSRKYAEVKAFSAVSLPFVVAETLTGLVSLFTGWLSIPPVLGIGTAVDLAILVVGAVLASVRVRKAVRLPAKAR